MHVHERMSDMKEKLELTTNTLVANVIEDWIDMAEEKTDLSDRLEIARYALKVKKRKENKK